MRKTALLTGVAGLFLMTAPAFAQDSTAPQTPPAPAEQPAQEAPQSLTLNPGQTIVSSDGQDMLCGASCAGCSAGAGGVCGAVLS